jgi:uncharacterized membrane protein
MVVMNAPDAAPAGWKYNPSDWRQRLPIALVALIAGLLALYLAAYQMRWIPWVWDPVFGEGSPRVLESPVSRLFPVSDALLGALGYLAECATSLIGGVRRYRTMPWMVMIFGFTCVPFTLVAIALLLIMPTILKAWCFICILTTILSFILTPFAWDEVWASILEMRSMMREGASFWQAFSGSAGR